MKLIVGLGNPGKDYAGSRHNVGFTIVRQLAKRYRITLKKDKESCSLSGCGRIGAEKAALAMPFTFMNLSGGSVKALLKNYRIRPDELLVICDDLDLGLGRLKIRSKGSSGGHRGLSSVIAALGGNDFCRLRIGIGRPKEKSDAADYVLSTFNKNEKKQLETIINKALDCCGLWMIKGITDCMNTFNKRSNQK